MARTVLLGVLTLLTACPSNGERDGLPSCEELACQEGSVCLDGACRARDCLALECDDRTVCQPGPLCLPARQAGDPVCESLECDEGYLCQEGMRCRPSNEDLDADRITSQLDCDDGNPSRFPGNPEICDGLDNDCDGARDEDARCRDGLRCCGAAGCVSLDDDRQHCGACGQPCAMYEECAERACVTAEVPLVTSASPDPIPTGQWLGRDRVNPFIVDGEHLLGYATVYITSLDGESSASPFEVVGAPDGRYYVIDQPILIDGAELGPGPATLWIVRNDGVESNTIEVEVQGAEAPLIDRVSPSPLRLAEETILSIYGAGFWGQPTVMISPELPIFEWRELPLLWVTDTWLRTDSIYLDPTTNPPGYWIMRVQNPDGARSALFPLDVEPAPAPTLTGLSPSEAMLGEEVTLQVFGFDMFGTPELSIAPESSPDDPLDSIPIAMVDARRLVTVPFTVEPGVFASQPYLVWVTNPDEASSNRLRFVVLE